MNRTFPTSALPRQAACFTTTAFAAVLLSQLGSLLASAPAHARMTQCQIRHSQCSERCIMNKSGEGAINACITRTCDHQNPGCGPDSIDQGGGKGRGGKRATGFRIGEQPGGSRGTLFTPAPGGPVGASPHRAQIGRAHV